MLTPLPRTDTWGFLSWAKAYWRCMNIPNQESKKRSSVSPYAGWKLTLQPWVCLVQGLSLIRNNLLTGSLGAEGIDQCLIQYFLCQEAEIIDPLCGLTDFSEKLHYIQWNQLFSSSLLARAVNQQQAWMGIILQPSNLVCFFPSPALQYCSAKPSAEVDWEAKPENLPAVISAPSSGTYGWDSRQCPLSGVALLAGAVVMLSFIHSFPTLICGFESPALQQHALHRDTSLQRKDGITLMCASWFVRAHTNRKETKPTTKHTTREQALLLCCCCYKSYKQRGDKITSAQAQKAVEAHGCWWRASLT